MDGITVIMPCYNAGSDILEAVQSVLDQDFDLAPYEIVIVNDCSTDTATLNALEKIKNFTAAPITVIDQNKNQGPSAARNTALKHAQYDYILPVDADDKLVTGKGDNGYLHQIYKSFQNDPEIDIVYSKLRLFGAYNGSLHVSDYNEKLMILTNLLIVSSGYKKDMALKIGGYDENVFGAEDYLFWITLLNECHKEGRQAKVKLIDDELYLYRQHTHGNNVDASHGHTYIELMKMLVDKNPEIYATYFSKVSKDELPEYLTNKVRMMLKISPYESTDDAKKWFNDYTARYQL